MKTNLTLLLLTFALFSCLKDLSQCPGEYDVYEFSMDATYKHFSVLLSWLFISDAEGKVIRESKIDENEINPFYIESPCQETYSVTRASNTYVLGVGFKSIVFETLTFLDGGYAHSTPMRSLYTSKWAFRDLPILVENIPDDIEDVIMPKVKGSVDFEIDELSRTLSFDGEASVTIGRTALIQIKRSSEDFYRGIFIDTDIDDELILEYNDFNLILESRQIELPRSSNWEYSIQCILIGDEYRDRAILKSVRGANVESNSSTIEVNVPINADIDSYLIAITEVAANQNPSLIFHTKKADLPAIINYTPSNLNATLVDNQLEFTGGDNLSYIKPQWHLNYDNAGYSVSWGVYSPLDQNNKIVLPEASFGMKEMFPFLHNDYSTYSLMLDGVQFEDGSTYEDIKHRIWQNENPFELEERGMAIEKWKIK